MNSNIKQFKRINIIEHLYVYINVQSYFTAASITIANSNFYINIKKRS